MNNLQILPNKIFGYCTTLVAAMVISFASLTTAQAYEMSISAEFKPDPSNPLINKFVNTTTPSGYCQYYSRNCETTGMFSLRAQIYFISNTTIRANHTDPRQGAIFHFPTDWRDLTVTHSQTGEQRTMRIRIKGFGTQYRVTPDDVRLLVNGGQPGINTLPAHRMLWGGEAWNIAPNTCLTASGWEAFSETNYAFFWETPLPGPCQKQAHFDIPYFRYNYFDFAYEIEAPDPLNMSTGNYTGNIAYTIGPNKDFDMGDVMVATDDTLSLNFTLTVQHALKVDIPPGGDKVELTPKGGWQQWLQKGRIPEKLSRDQTFLMSSSSRFKMQLVCDRTINDTCAISNGSHQVPVDVLVSMPNGVANDDNSAVSRKPLSVSTDLLFKSTFYVEQKPSTLHFEIQKQYVEQMLNEQGKYSGNITVVWDSDL
mgnify:CR=1 FL=1